MSGPVDIQRIRLRATIGVAAKVLAPTWPLERFVAVNPLLAFEDQPVERAQDSAAKVLGGSLRPPESYYREHYAAGRIDDRDLLAAIVDRHPDIAWGEPLSSGSVTMLPSEVVRLDLLLGEAIPVPSPPPVLRSEWLDRARGTGWSEAIDVHASRWASAYLDASSAWPMPRRELGLYAAWRRLAAADPSMRRLGGPRAAEIVADLPSRAEDAIAEMLVALWVDPAEHSRYLQRHLVRLPGWTAALAAGDRAIDDLCGFVALRLALEVVVLDHGDRRNAARAAAAAVAGGAVDGPTAADRAAVVLTHLSSQGRRVSGATLSQVAAVLDAVSPSDRMAIWQQAFEQHYADRLVADLDAGRGVASMGAASSGRPDDADVRPRAQIVCCIDPRSEGLRRHLETGGRYETLGFGGFFGLPVAIQGIDDPHASPACPVLLEPKVTVEERPTSDTERAHLEGTARAASIDDSLHETKLGGASPFAFAEAAGWASGPLAMARTFAPAWSGRLGRRLRSIVRREADTELTIDRSLGRGGVWLGMLDEEKVAMAHAVLTTMSLTSDFARVVLFCGHGSDHVNNPFRSSLDCGACAGRPGGNNARVAVALLNDPRVRAGLRPLGIDVPEATVFVAGEHETTTDRVRLFDLDLVPPSHRVEVEQLAAALRRAGGALRSERAASLPASVGRPSTRPSRVDRRASDWAQVVPEWGLANNAAMVIGPRSLTAPVDLGRRVFLHSYDPAIDVEGTVLEAVMTGPLVVAHWISSQYLASAVDPARFGAGTKPLHNALGALGVIEGARGDLRLGLPLESVSLLGERVHEPMRLFAVIDAPSDRVDMVVGRNAVLSRLVDHGWVRLAARGGPHQGWLRRTRDRRWVAWSMDAGEYQRHPQPAMEVPA